MMSNDPFFDDFPDLQVDWSKIDETQLNDMISKLQKQDVEKIFSALQDSINSNNQVKSIVGVSLKVLEVLVGLGMKVL
jgi:hypothetical protein